MRQPWAILKTSCYLADLLSVLKVLIALFSFLYNVFTVLMNLPGYALVFFTNFDLAWSTMSGINGPPHREACLCFGLELGAHPRSVNQT